MRRIVIDTNVAVSGFHGGNPRKLLDLWRMGAVVVCVSEAILQKYREVLGRFSRFARDTPAFSDRLRDPKHAVFVTPAEPIRAISSDPDDMFLACAVAAQADFIVSDDHHLLELGAFRGLRIVSPAEALELLGEE